MSFVVVLNVVLYMIIQRDASSTDHTAQLDQDAATTEPDAVLLDQDAATVEPGTVKFGQDMEAVNENQRQVSGTSTASKKKRTTYDYIPADLKRKIVDYATQHGIRTAAQLFDINEPTIRYWKQKGFALSRGRKITYGKDLDKEIYGGLLLLKSNGAPLTVDQFTEYAKKIIDERRPELNFKCSRGWLEKFFKRHNLEVVKSPSGKVMNIVESKKDPTNFTLNDSATEIEQEEEDDHDGYESSEWNRSSENPIGNTEHLLEQNVMEDLGPSAKRLRLATSTIDPNLEHDSMTPSIHTATTSINSQETTEGQKVKMQHIRDILKKLVGHLPPVTSYQKHEVVEHAKLNGSRSAERKFGVPETTIRYWVKKSLSSPQVQPTNVHLPSISAIPRIEMNNSITGHHSDSISATLPNVLPLGAGLSSNSSHISMDSPRRRLTPEDTVAACRMLHWATDQTLQGVGIGFDELCDRALAHISQNNPASAYSSTRKWVTQVLNLQIRDLLGIQE